MIGVLGGLSLIVGLFSLIDTSTSTSFSVTYLVIGIVLPVSYTHLTLPTTSRV